MSYNELYGHSHTASFSGSAVWTIISVVLALIGGIAAYYLFIKKNNKLENKKLEKLREFLNFKTLVIEDILKITYAILAIFITLTSFNFIGTNFLTFLIQLIGGNMLLRIVYESSLLLVMIWKNTTEINKKMNK